MISAGAEYQEYEAQAIGATPAVRITILPHHWPPGVGADGDYLFTSFIAPDRVQADNEGFHGFDYGYWMSLIQAAEIQVTTTPAVLTWVQNSPGFTITVFYRTAATSDLLEASSWVPVASGTTINLQPYYQLMASFDGYRAWAIDGRGDGDSGESWFDSDYSGDSGDPDPTTAWAIDGTGESWDDEEKWESSACDPEQDDLLTYIETLSLLGEFTIIRDIETAGTLTMEAPTDFSDLVSGDHSGVTLNNRQGAFDALLNWVGAPLYSPNKSTFVFAADGNWYDGKRLRLELGWSRGGWFRSGFLEDEWMTESFTELVTLFLGKICKWGPVSRGTSTPHNVEIYAKDLIADCLKKRICLPALDGTPAPVTYGEALCEGKAISGWSPAPIVKTAYFNYGDFRDLSRTVISGIPPGALTILSPGIITGDYALRAAVAGASQQAYGVISMTGPGQMFITGEMRFQVVPASSFSDFNMTFLRFMSAGGSSALDVFVNSNGNIHAYNSLLGWQEGKFNVRAYEGVPLVFALWIDPVSLGGAKLWINGDEVINFSGALDAYSPQELWMGVGTSGIAENWTIDYGKIDIRQKYYNNAYRVTGAPFADIGTVYIDNVAQPPTQMIGGLYTQTCTRHPQHGIVQFESDDSTFKVSGDVLIRVVEHAGGRHALDITIALLLHGLSSLATFTDFDAMITAWFACTKDTVGIAAFLVTYGLSDYFIAADLAAAYVAVPNDLINARFVGGEVEPQGLKDIANLGLSVAEALIEITTRCLYWLFIDHGVVKIIPYTGIPPADPVMALDDSHLYEAQQTIDMEEINAFVSGIYGWYSRDPSLYYVAGDQTAGGQGTGLDFSWDSPVACELRETVKSKVDLLLKFLSAKDILDPVRMNLAGARLELMDTVSVSDPLLNDAATNYKIGMKTVGLDRGSRETTLQLLRILGE